MNPSAALWPGNESKLVGSRGLGHMGQVEGMGMLHPQTPSASPSPPLPLLSFVPPARSCRAGSVPLGILASAPAAPASHPAPPWQKTYQTLCHGSRHHQGHWDGAHPAPAEPRAPLAAPFGSFHTTAACAAASAAMGEAPRRRRGGGSEALLRYEFPPLVMQLWDVYMPL